MGSGAMPDLVEGKAQRLRLKVRLSVLANFGLALLAVAATTIAIAAIMRVVELEHVGAIGSHHALPSSSRHVASASPLKLTLRYSADTTAGATTMPIVEQSASQLVLKSGSTTLDLDKAAGKAFLRRKFLFWPLKPVETPIAEVVGVNVDTAIDRASGVEVCNTMMVMRSGAAWALAATDKQDANAMAAAVRGFLNLPG